MPDKLPLPALLVLLLLSALLFAAGTAPPAPAGPAGVPFLYEEEFEAEEEGEEVETECDTAHEEADEGELGRDEAEEICDEEEAAESKTKDKKSGAKTKVPEDCVLRSAHAHASISDKTDKLKLTLGYTTYEPANARIKVGNLATLNRHLGRSGVLRLVEPLGEKHPKRLVVNLKLRGTKGAGCPFRRLVLFPR